MKVLVTGADGFVGRWLSAELVAAGHSIIGCTHTAAPALGNEWLLRLQAVRWMQLDITNAESIGAALALRPDAVVHLAAVASGAEARADPLRAWRTNCLGTATVAYSMERLRVRSRLLLASTGEVYGSQLMRAAREDDPVRPCSPYAASKAASETVALEYYRRVGGDVVISRPFAQTGPGQRVDFVVPAFAHRVLEAKRRGVKRVAVGNLEPVREFLDVRDVAAALRCLLEQGTTGEVYNIARGVGTSLRELFQLICEVAEWPAEPEVDTRLFRPADIPYLVGDGQRIAALGWKPKLRLGDTLRDLIQDLEGDPASAWSARRAEGERE